MLKLVTKGFYNELINCAVGQPDVIRVASRLLDNLLAKGKRPDKEVGYYSGTFTLASVKDAWAERKQLVVQHLTIRPLQKQVVNKIGDWLKDRAVLSAWLYSSHSGCKSFHLGLSEPHSKACLNSHA